MMPRGSTLLLPVNPVFIWFSLLVAFTIVPWAANAAYSLVREQPAPWAIVAASNSGRWAFFSMKRSAAT